MFGMPAPGSVRPLEPSGAIVKCDFGASGGPGLPSLFAWAGADTARVRAVAVATAPAVTARRDRTEGMWAPKRRRAPGCPAVVTLCLLHADGKSRGTMTG